MDTKRLKWTIILLCMGYAMDFYDLTIFAVGYYDIITQQFQIIDTDQIQQIRIYISNWQNIGVVLGAFIFGILGDKIGRATIIKYSILLYSIATLLGIFAHQIWLFSMLRFLAGIGLASEFATSNILIAELFPKKWANWYSVFLYCFGILGGFAASMLGFLSWKIMFFIGGVGGLIIFILRRKLQESALLLNVIEKQKNIVRGKISDLFKKKLLAKTVKFYITNIVFHALITYMFFFPQFMNLEIPHTIAIKLLLVYFFIGNIIGALLAGVWIHYIKNYTSYLLINFFIVLLVVPLFPLITQHTFALYCILFGVFAGGTPVAWVQLASKSYGTNIRSTATNFIFGLGRWTGIGFNIMLSLCISYNVNLKYFMWITFIAFSIISIITILFIKNNYYKNINYTE